MAWTKSTGPLFSNFARPGTFTFISSLSVPLARMVGTIAASARPPARTVAMIAKTLVYTRRRMRTLPQVSTARVSHVVRLTRFAGIVAYGRSDAYAYLPRRVTDAEPPKHGLPIRLDILLDSV